MIAILVALAFLVLGFVIGARTGYARAVEEMLQGYTVKELHDAIRKENNDGN